MKKKILFFGAALAAVATFTSCSNDEDLVQAPEPQPVEEPAVKGIPFSVSAFDNSDVTRAVRYGEDGTGYDYVAGETKTVTMFKLYGIADGAENPWIDNYVFTRTSTTDWKAARYKSGDEIEGSLVWGDTEHVTTFYAITDNSFGTSATAKDSISGVQSFGGASFSYSIPTKTVDATELNTISIGTDAGWVTPDWMGEVDEFVGADTTKIKDLMVATASKQPTANDGAIVLPFVHTLAGLSVKAKFRDTGWVGKTCTILGLRVHGLWMEGTYTIGSGWSELKNTSVHYYKLFDNGANTDGVDIDAEADDGTGYVDLVYPGEWLVIPQNVSKASIAATDNFPTSGTFLEVLFTDDNTGQGDYGVCYYPFHIDFKAGKNYTLVLNIMKMINPVYAEPYYTEGGFNEP